MTLSDYLRKRASIAADSTTTTIALTKDIAALAAAATTLAGVGAGYGLSRFSSPREADIANDRKQYLLTDMKLRVAKLKRERELEGLDEAEEAPAKPAREIRL